MYSHLIGLDDGNILLSYVDQSNGSIHLLLYIYIYKATKMAMNPVCIRHSTTIFYLTIKMTIKQ